MIASEKAFKRTADMRDGGEALADSDRYKDAIDDLADDRLAHVFVDTKAIVDATLAEDPEVAASFEQFKSFLPVDKLGPTVASLQADGDAIVVDSATTGVPEGPFRSLVALTSGGSTDLTADLPGDAWGAFALPKLGETAKTLFSSFAGAIGGAAAAGEVKRQTGLDLEQDVFSWIGDTGVFIRGASEPELDGALVIESTDDAKAAPAFGKIVGLIGKEDGVRPEPVRLEGAESAFSFTSPDTDKPIVLARGSGRVVAAYGEDAAKAALSPGDEARRRRALRRREGRARRRHGAGVPALDAGRAQAGRRDRPGGRRLRQGEALPRGAERDRVRRRGRRRHGEVADRRHAQVARVRATRR